MAKGVKIIHFFVMKANTNNTNLLDIKPQAPVNPETGEIEPTPEHLDEIPA